VVFAVITGLHDAPLSLFVALLRAPNVTAIRLLRPRILTEPISSLTN